jgi:two-component sensor histidine kinase
MKGVLLGMDTVLNFERPANLAVGESNHRIANNLAAISNLIRKKAKNAGVEASVEDARQILLDASGRIDTIARLHRLLAPADGAAAVPVALFLRDVCAAMESIVVGDEQVSTTVDCPGGLSIPPLAALPLGLLTAELFSNSAKYAHPTGLPTIIRISCSRAQDGMLAFMFEDDGVGFPEDFDPARDGSLGMRVAEALSEQLHGQHEWQDTGIGLRYICRFPA